MSVSISDLTEPKENETKSAALLNKYLTTACYYTYKETALEAQFELSKLAKSKAWEGIEMSDVVKKQKEVKAAMSEHGLKEKAAYYANLKAGEHMKETTLKVGAFAVAAIVGSQIDPSVGQAIGLGAVAYFGSKMAAGTYGEVTASNSFTTRDYVDLKHASIALNKLQKHMEKKELDDMRQKAMASGAYIPLVSGRGGFMY
ncbi:MAG: hypothetical protein MJ250_06180 [Alphaproteobacteria bacterium]|nr:hypothetical protein [Alphaproteobacteria bacterium]